MSRERFLGALSPTVRGEVEAALPEHEGRLRMLVSNYMDEEGGWPDDPSTADFVARTFVHQVGDFDPRYGARGLSGPVIAGLAGAGLTVATGAGAVALGSSLVERYGMDVLAYSMGLQPQMLRTVINIYNRTTKVTDWSRLGFSRSGEQGGIPGFVLDVLGKNFEREVRRQLTGLFADVAWRGARSALYHTTRLTLGDRVQEVPWVVNYLDRFIVAQMSTHERTVNHIVNDSIQRGLSENQIRSRVRQTWMLDPRLAQAVTNHERALINRKTPANRRRELVTRYIDRVKRSRARTISTTEAITLFNMGRDREWQRAVQNGEMPIDTVKMWVTKQDELVCDVCEPMDGQTAPLGEPFNSSAGNPIVPSVHPNCRCDIIPVREAVNVSGKEFIFPVKEVSKHLGGPDGNDPHPSGTPQSVHGGGKNEQERLRERFLMIRDAPHDDNPMLMGPMFHGTNADLDVGDVIEPRTKGSANATPWIRTAREFSRGGKVFRVEPLEGDDTLWSREMPHTGSETHYEIRSDKGFRIVEQVPKSRDDSFYAEERKKATEEWYQSKVSKHLGGPDGTDPHPSGTPQAIHAGYDAAIAEMKEGAYDFPMEWLVNHVRGSGIRIGQRNRIKSIANSILENGFTDPIIMWVYEDGEPFIRDGMHRLEAAHMLGLERVPVAIRHVEGEKPKTDLRGRFHAWRIRSKGPQPKRDTPFEDVKAERGFVKWFNERQQQKGERKAAPERFEEKGSIFDRVKDLLPFAKADEGPVLWEEFAKHEGPGPHDTGTEQKVHGRGRSGVSDDPWYRMDRDSLPSPAQAGAVLGGAAAVMVTRGRVRSMSQLVNEMRGLNRQAAQGLRANSQHGQVLNFDTRKLDYMVEGYGFRLGNKSHIQKMANAMREGTDLFSFGGKPNPIMVMVYRDGAQVLDGKHRLAAARMVGRRQVPIQVAHVDRNMPSPASFRGHWDEWRRRLYQAELRSQPVPTNVGPFSPRQITRPEQRFNQWMQQRSAAVDEEIFRSLGIRRGVSTV